MKALKYCDKFDVTNINYGQFSIFKLNGFESC